MYDVIIIGSGVAGMSAAIYAARAELKMAVIEKEPISGGQIINTSEVDNYPGMPGIGGFELAEAFRSHADKLGTEFIEGTVQRIEVISGTDAAGSTNDNEGQPGEGSSEKESKSIKRIILEDGRAIDTKTVIIATGAGHRSLGVPGESSFAGMGVSYCATCDGAFFKGRDVAVVGGGDTAIQDALYLARLCRKVYVIHRRDSFRAARSLSSKLLACENVEVLWDSVPDSIEGSDVVETINVRNVKSGEVRPVSVNAVFIAVGIEPHTEAFRGFVPMNESGYILADETCVTNVDGVYAAGDCRAKQLRQVITAAADGANAITSVERYLA